MAPTRRLFLVTWLASLALVAHCWMEYAHFSQVLRDREGLLGLSMVIGLMPWVAGPAMLLVLRRMESGGVNLPHAEYWFTGGRRAASLDRLSPYLDGMGTLLSAYLSAVLALFISERVDERAESVSAVLFLAATLAFLGGTVWWVRRVMRAFPEPESTTRGRRPFRRRP